MDLFFFVICCDLYLFYDQLRVILLVLYLFGFDLCVVFGYNAVKRALFDHEMFSFNVGPSRGNRFEWLLFMDLLCYI